MAKPDIHGIRSIFSPIQRLPSWRDRMDVPSRCTIVKAMDRQGQRTGYGSVVGSRNTNKTQKALE
jgi:hypothetical protein